MNIEEARTHVYEYMAMCGQGMTEFTTALDVLYTTTIQQEEIIKGMQRDIEIKKRVMK